MDGRDADKDGSQNRPAQRANSEKSGESMNEWKMDTAMRRKGREAGRGR